MDEMMELLSPIVNHPYFVYGVVLVIFIILAYQVFKSSNTLSKVFLEELENATGLHADENGEVPEEKVEAVLDQTLTWTKKRLENDPKNSKIKKLLVKFIMNQRLKKSLVEFIKSKLNEGKKQV